jgi:hypothetical protein
MVERGADGPATHPGGDKKPIVACLFRFRTRTHPTRFAGHGAAAALALARAALARLDLIGRRRHNI